MLQLHKKENNVILKYKTVLFAFAFGEWIDRYEYKRKKRRRQTEVKIWRGRLFYEIFQSSSQSCGPQPCELLLFSLPL